MAYRRKSYFRECPFCGAALDPGETCDCRRSMEQVTGTEQAAEQPARGPRMRLVYETGGQMRMETV